MPHMNRLCSLSSIDALPLIAAQSNSKFSLPRVMPDYFTSSMVDSSHSAIPGNIATSTTAAHIRKNSGSA
jgi:hypothetical protein